MRSSNDFLSEVTASARIVAGSTDPDERVDRARELRRLLGSIRAQSAVGDAMLTGSLPHADACPRLLVAAAATGDADFGVFLERLGQAPGADVLHTGRGAAEAPNLLKAVNAISARVPYPFPGVAVFDSPWRDWFAKTAHGRGINPVRGKIHTWICQDARPAQRLFAIDAVATLILDDDAHEVPEALTRDARNEVVDRIDEVVRAVGEPSAVRLSDPAMRYVRARAELEELVARPTFEASDVDRLVHAVDEVGRRLLAKRISYTQGLRAGRTGDMAAIEQVLPVGLRLAVDQSWREPSLKAFIAGLRRGVTGDFGFAVAGHLRRLLRAVRVRGDIEVCDPFSSLRGSLVGACVGMGDVGVVEWILGDAHARPFEVRSVAQAIEEALRDAKAVPTEFLDRIARWLRDGRGNTWSLAVFLSGRVADPQQHTGDAKLWAERAQRLAARRGTEHFFVEHGLVARLLEPGLSDEEVDRRIDAITEDQQRRTSPSARADIYAAELAECHTLKGQEALLEAWIGRIEEGATSGHEACRLLKALRRHHLTFSHPAAGRRTEVEKLAMRAFRATVSNREEVEISRLALAAQLVLIAPDPRDPAITEVAGEVECALAKLMAGKREPELQNLATRTARANMALLRVGRPVDTAALPDGAQALVDAIRVLDELDASVRQAGAPTRDAYKEAGKRLEAIESPAGGKAGYLEAVKLMVHNHKNRLTFDPTSPPPDTLRDSEVFRGLLGGTSEPAAAHEVPEIVAQAVALGASRFPSRAVEGNATLAPPPLGWDLPTAPLLLVLEEVIGNALEHGTGNVKVHWIAGKPDEVPSLGVTTGCAEVNAAVIRIEEGMRRNGGLSLARKVSEFVLGFTLSYEGRDEGVTFQLAPGRT